MLDDDEILRLRAQRIAGRQKGLQYIGEDQLTVLEFLLSAEKYAIESQFVTEVFLLRNLTPVPGAPPFLAGMCNHRGKIISLINLKIVFDMQNRGITDLNKVIMLRYKDTEFGILADSVAGTRNTEKTFFKETQARADHAHANFISGISETGVNLIDSRKLLTSKTLIINQK